MVTCLERGADLHMAQLMLLPLIVSCFSKIQIGLPFWYRLTRVVPDKGPLNGGGCVCHLAVVQPGLGPYKNQTSEVMFLVTKLRVKNMLKCLKSIHRRLHVLSICKVPRM